MIFRLDYFDINYILCGNMVLEYRNMEPFATIPIPKATLSCFKWKNKLCLLRSL